ncbi:MAG: hypothetical protein K0V04_05115 [Deltaproteobacteria bacterium]|nr:hypothetical protein [Deltaproteobacteria bacterium]
MPRVCLLLGLFGAVASCTANEGGFGSAATVYVATTAAEGSSSESATTTEGRGSTSGANTSAASEGMTSAANDTADSASSGSASTGSPPPRPPPAGSPWGPCNAGTCDAEGDFCFQLQGQWDMCWPPCVDGMCPEVPPGGTSAAECADFMGGLCLIDCSNDTLCPPGAECVPLPPPNQAFERCLWPL